MKHILILIYLLPLTVFSQAWFDVYPYTTNYKFETNDNYQYLTFDSISNQTNIWQIGKPQKTILNTTISSNTTNEYVIITDSLAPYPINDTSSFTIQIPIPEYATDFYLTGHYNSDTDSLNDYGKIEYSMDNGLNWVLISDDTLIYTNQNYPNDSIIWPTYYNNSNQPIVLTGLSNGWQHFHINLLESYQIFDHTINQNWSDTALYRFTFISDNIFDNRDGLMFDNITIVNVFAFSIDENESNSITVYPNPLISNIINFENRGINQVKIYDLNSKLVYDKDGLSISKVELPDLPKGVYLLNAITKENQVLTTKIVVQ